MKQILLLEKGEMQALKSGEALTINLPGGTTIMLQVEDPKPNRRLPDPIQNKGRVSAVRSRVVEYLEKHGPSRMVEIRNALGVSASAVSSLLTSNRTGQFKHYVRTHKWGLK